MHILHIFGRFPDRCGYLNVGYETALARYIAEEHGQDRAPYFAMPLDDIFVLFEEASDVSINLTDITAALAQHEVRADITELLTTIGLHAAFTTMGQAIGALIMDREPPQRRRRGATEAKPSRFYVVTERLGERLQRVGGRVATTETLTIWLREGTGELCDDLLLQQVLAA